MANFFKSASSTAFSVKGFPSSKASCSASRFDNVNMTRNANMPVLSQFDSDATISPLSKEIDSRLKVLNKILPHEEVVQLSQDFINRLNSACYDKIAKSVCSGSAAPSVISCLNKAAKSIQNDLRTINEEPQDDSICFRKPVAPVRRQKQRADQKKKTSSSSVRVNSKKKKIEEVDMSTGSCDLTITKTSLRSSAVFKKKEVESCRKQKATSKKTVNNTKVEESNLHYEEEDSYQDKEDSITMLQIQGRPKKTALSPFFNRFKQRCSANRTTSTPFKL